MNGTITGTLVVLAMVCSMLTGCGNGTNSDFSTIGIFIGGGPSPWKVSTSKTFRNNTTVSTTFTYDATKFLTKTVATTTSGAGSDTATTTYVNDVYGNPIQTVVTSAKPTVTTDTTYGYGTNGTIIFSTAVTKVNGVVTGSVGKSITYLLFGTGKIETTTTFDASGKAILTDSSTFDALQNIIQQVLTVSSNPPVTTIWTNSYDTFNPPRLTKVVKKEVNGTELSTTLYTYNTGGNGINKLQSYAETVVDPASPVSSVVGTSNSGDYDVNGNVMHSSVTTTFKSGPPTVETLDATWINLTTGATSP